MTTSSSPLRVLKAQADGIAKMIKAAERGEPIAAAYAEKLAEARAKGEFVVGIAQDDKIIKLTLPWPAIASTSEVALAALILKHMRGEREQ